MQIDRYGRLMKTLAISLESRLLWVVDLLRTGVG
jgi:hypothetical protein